MKKPANLPVSPIKQLQIIPGVGKSIARDLVNIGIKNVDDLKGRVPDDLYHQSNRFAGIVQDRCLLYVFRCAVYFAETPPEEREPEKLKWWNWKDGGIEERELEARGWRFRSGVIYPPYPIRGVE